MSDFKAKRAPNSMSAGARPQIPLGELTALPKPPADTILALGPPGFETICPSKYVSLNPPMMERVKQWHAIALLGDRPGRHHIRGDTLMKLFFICGITLEGGEGGSGEETMTKKVITFQRTMTKKGRQFS